MKFLKSISFIETNIQNMPFKNEIVDKILLSRVLQRVNNDILLIEEYNNDSCDRYSKGKFRGLGKLVIICL